MLSPLIVAAWKIRDVMVGMQALLRRFLVDGWPMVVEYPVSAGSSRLDVPDGPGAAIIHSGLCRRV